MCPLFQNVDPKGHKIIYLLQAWIRHYRQFVLFSQSSTVGWRIQDFPEEKAPTPKLGMKNYYLVCSPHLKKMHGNVRNLTKKEHIPAPPPPPDPSVVNITETTC